MNESQIATALIDESGETNIWGSPVIKVYAAENYCYIPEDKGEIESAIAESIKYVDKSKRTYVLLLVEVIPMSQRRRRATPRRRKTQASDLNCATGDIKAAGNPQPRALGNPRSHGLGNARVRRRRSGGEEK